MELSQAAVIDAPRRAVRGDLDEEWLSSFESTARWVAVHGRLPIAGATDPAERRLGLWCLAQRRQHRSGNLSSARATALTRAPWWTWHPRRNDDRSWLDRHARLVDWYTKNGRFPNEASSNLVEEALARWCERQRYLYRRGELSASRVAALRALSWWTWTKAV